MKVVIFCGGLGLRLREYSENVPKPLVPIGDHPIVWHLMRYYSYYGHRDFVLCLGHKGEAIKKYFLNYNEALSSDFVLAKAGRDLQLLSTEFANWRITCIDTGRNSMIGERLMAVREHVQNEEVFLANYVDGLSDVDLDYVVDRFRQSGKTACFVSVPPNQTFHLVDMDRQGRVTGINHAATSNTWINGGYFVLSKRIFEFMRPGEDLVNEPFQRLIAAGELITVRHTGFWACMDTFKERQQLEDLWCRAAAPWQVWLKNGRGAAQGARSRAPGTAGRSMAALAGSPAPVSAGGAEQLAAGLSPNKKK
jgi:glucose-1-phosphate cytidylyltransferase